MDRHVEFATQLSHLVALYARDPLDHAAEKAALRAVRGASKHGAIELLVVDGTLHAGKQAIESPDPEVASLAALLTTLGVMSVGAPHHAKQDDVKRFAKLLGAVGAGQMTPRAFADELGTRGWTDLAVERVVAAAPPDALSAPEEIAVEAPVETLVATPAEIPVETSVEEVGETPTDAPHEASGEMPSDVVEDFGPPLPQAELPGKPLAEQLPAAVEDLAGPAYRELFERLITSSEPLTLRRLLEPVQAAIEQAVRDGQIVVSARLVAAMFVCEACADDSEMRRQFVVTLRRLTKPTLTRAYAMSYADLPEAQADLEQALARFGEDGAEAVADCFGSAPTRETRALYLALLGRLPGTNDALLAMLDDQREIVVERAIALIVALRHPEMERVLGEQLSRERPRVRQAAVRGLAAATESAFAADALVRAAQDAAPEVRLAAAVALQARKEERIIAALLPLVDAEDELDVQLALVTVLGKIATPDGVQKLIALANPTERMMRRRRAPVLRLTAIEALGEARTPAAMTALQRLLEDKEKEVREAAARLYTRARRQTAAIGMPAVSGS